MFYRWLADAVLIMHAGVIAFVLLGLVITLIGAAKHWGWVRNIWFRAAHMATIAIVMLQAWAGVVCPFTTWENRLRIAGGEAAYGGGGFIQYWLQRLIFFEAEPWVFTVAYTSFALLVAATFYFAPPRWPWKKGDQAIVSVAERER